MADETTFRFILDDAPSQSAASGGAAPVAGPAPRRAAASSDPADIGDQYHAYQQMEAFRREAEADKEESLSEKEAAREESRAAREQLAAERRAGVQADRDQRSRNVEQELLDNSAASATGKAQNSILAGFSNLPIFGQTISILQGVARPLVAAADALEAIAATRNVAAGASQASAAIPQPPTINVGGAAAVATQTAASGAAGASGALLVAGAAAAAAAAAVAFVGVAKAASAVDHAFTEQAKRLATLNAGLAGAQAQARVEGLLQDVRSARTLGPELADFTTSRSSIDRSLQRITDVISKAALEKINPSLEAMATILEVMSKQGPAIERAVEFVGDRIGEQLLGTLPWEAIKAGMSAIEEQTKEVKRQNQRGDLFTLFQDIPDLTLEEKTGPGVFQLEPVHFDAVGGAQLP